MTDNRGHNSGETTESAVTVTKKGADQLRGFIGRIERQEAEKQDIAEGIKETYAEAKGAGFDVKTIRKLVALRKKDPETLSEERALLDLYGSALGMDIFG